MGADYERIGLTRGGDDVAHAGELRGRGSGWCGESIGFRAGVFALAMRPGAEFGYVDFDWFKVE
jgi:hypothetical protein